MIIVSQAIRIPLKWRFSQLMPHMGLDVDIPADRARILVEDPDKWKTIQAAAKSATWWDFVKIIYLEGFITILCKTCFMGKYRVIYTVIRVKEGYLAQCAANPIATAFGQTVDEAGNNLAKALLEYVKLYPDKENDIFNATPTNEVVVGG